MPIHASRNIRSRTVKQLRRSAKAMKLLVSLMCQGDAGALHDIRVQIRTVSSLLKPFLDLPHMLPLRRTLEPIKAWVRKSNGVRDSEAQLELIANLIDPPYPDDVNLYLASAGRNLHRRRAALAKTKGLAKMPRRIKRLCETAADCLEKMPNRSLNETIALSCAALLSELREDCAGGLQSVKRWHQARLRIKQLRYLIECYHDFLDPRFGGFSADTKLAQDSLGRLRDWQNLNAAMAGKPDMAKWLASHGEVEAQLVREATAAMDFLDAKLKAWV